MKRLFGFLGRGLLFLAFASASAVLVGGILLYGLERSGWLAEYVAAEVQGRLGDSGAEFALGELELDWFGPAVTLHDLRLGADGRLARIHRATLVVAPFAPPSRRVRHVRVDGGRVRLSPELFDALERLAGEPAPARPGEPPAMLDAAFELPPVELNGVQFDVGHPQWGDFPLGAVDAVLARGEHGRAELRGVLAPSMADAGDRDAAVYLGGHVARPGILSVHLSTAGFPVSAEALPPGTPLEALRGWQPTGRLALDAQAELSLDPEEPSSVALRAKLADASLTRAGTGLAVRGIEIDLEASRERGEPRAWFDPRSWSARAALSGDWKGSRLVAFARLGAAAGPGRLVRAELHAPVLAVSAESLSELGLWPLARQAYEAFAPSGHGDLALALALDEARGWSGAADLRLDGGLTAAYHGFPSRTGRGIEGFPLPVRGLTGRAAFAFDASLARPFQVGLIDLRGKLVDGVAGVGGAAESAVAEIRGSIAAQPRGSPPTAGPEVALEFRAGGLSVGEPMRRAIEGLHGTQWIWPAFAPSAGVVDARGRVMATVASEGVAAQFEIEPWELALTWEGLPVTLAHGHGRIDLSLDPRRAFGLGFDLTGTTATAESVRLRGRVQQDPALAPPREVEVPPEKTARELLMDFDVDVRGMALRGSDREVVASTWPGVGAALDLFQPSGKADVTVRTARARPDEPLEYRVEVEPRQVQLTPKSFSTPTRNVAGRVIVHGFARAEAEESLVTTRLAPLLGEWPQDARVACSAVFGSAGAAQLSVLGAGVDVTNRALIGAFREAFAGGSEGGGFDLQALSIDGRIDFAAEVALGEDAAAPARGEGVYRVFLRDNSFRAEAHAKPAEPAEPGREAAAGFGLAGLWGELVQQDGVLTGAQIQARLGSTAVLLRNARFVEQGGAPRFTTRVEARGLPLDREHLSFFLDPETVDAAIDGLHLSGWIDFEDVELAYTGKTQRADAQLALAGAVRPRDAFVDLGLPLSIEHAQVELHELVLEGGRVRAWAKVAELAGAIANRRLAGASMLVTYVQPRLSILDLSGELEGGRISDLAQVGGPEDRERTRASGPAFTMDLLDPYTFELGLALREVELSGLLRGMFESEFADTGVLDAEIRLQGSLERLTGITGDGYVHLRDTRLWSIPVVRDLLSQLGMDSTAVFEQMKSRFTLQDGVIRMDAIEVESPLLQLVGSGRLDLDGRLKHDLQVRYSLVDRLGPLTRMLYWVQNNLLSISVRGDMSRPQIVLKGMLSLLRREGRDQRELPLPSLSPLPERF